MTCDGRDQYRLYADEDVYLSFISRVPVNKSERHVNDKYKPFIKLHDYFSFTLKKDGALRFRRAASLYRSSYIKMIYKMAFS